MHKIMRQGEDRTKLVKALFNLQIAKRLTLHQAAIIGGGLKALDETPNLSDKNVSGFVDIFIKGMTEAADQLDNHLDTL